MSRVIETLNVDEDMPIEMKILSNTIESAQRKVESQNYSMRKYVLEYDNVMSRQRELIYSQRNKVLEGDDLKQSILKMFDETVENSVDLFCPNGTDFDEWNIVGLREKFQGWLTTSDDFKEQMTREEIKEMLIERGRKKYDEREEQFSPEITRTLSVWFFCVMLDNNVDGPYRRYGRAKAWNWTTCLCSKRPCCYV